MKELAVPDKTKCMASKAAVDLHDHLKRDMMTLFSLEKVLQKKVRTRFRFTHVTSRGVSMPPRWHCNSFLLPYRTPPTPPRVETSTSRVSVLGIGTVVTKRRKRHEKRKLAQGFALGVIRV